MAETYKILGQLAPTDTLEKVLYTSPTWTQTLITNITVTNRSNTPQTFDVNIYPYSKPSNQLDSAQIVTYGTTMSDGDKVLTTQDFVTWTESSLPVSRGWAKMAQGNGKAILLEYSYTGNNYNNQALITTDFATWTFTTMPTYSYWGKVVYGNNIFVAVSNAGYYNATTNTAASTDGITWTLGEIYSLGNWNVEYGNGIFVAVDEGSLDYGASNQSAVSTDGLNWTLGTLPASSYWSAIVYGNNNFVAISGGDYNFQDISAVSTDGLTWTEGTLPGSQWWTDIAFGDGRFIAVNGSDGDLALSFDGIVWYNLFQSFNSKYITYIEGQFIVVDEDRAYSSYDGNMWNYSDLDNSYYKGFNNVVSLNTSVPYVSPPWVNLYKNATILPNQSEILEPGITLGSQNTIVVKGTSDLTISAYGVELS